MNIDEFYREYRHLSKDRKKSAVEKLFNELMRDYDRYEDFILDIVHDAEELEGDDYFGTEGLDV